MPIAELAGGMQVLHIAAEERKLNEYVAVPAVQRLKVEARRDRREEGYGAGCTDIFIPTMTSKERVGRRWSRPRRSLLRTMVRLEERRRARIMDRTWERRRGPPYGDPLVHSAHAVHGLLIVGAVEFYAEIPAACQQRGRAGTAAACERIEYQLTGQCEAMNQRRQCRYRLLRRVQLVAAVRHVDHIGYWLLRQRWPALRQQVRLLVPIAEKPRLRAIRLAKHDVSDRLKARVFPCVEEYINLRPGVEHDGYAVHLEYPVRFPHRGLQPVGLRIVLDGASIAVAVIHQIRRVGEDEVCAVRRHLAHHLDAVAVKDRVDGKFLLDRIRVHDVTPFCMVSR
jgi:hypothetical protein